MAVIALKITILPADGSPAIGKTISLNLVEVSMLDFLRVISEVSGLNLLVDPDVGGTLTIHAESVPWDQLLEAVLDSHDLTHSERGPLIRISKKETLREQEENFKNLQLHTTTKQLSYANGKALIKTLESLLTQRGQVQLDQRTNTLIVKDIKKSIERITNLVELLDKPVRQVEIEARIVEATNQFSKQLGIEIGFRLGNSATRLGGGVSVIAPVDQPVGSAAISFGGMLDTVALDAAIAAAEITGDARMISKPRVTTLNNVEARIVQGAKIPIPVQMNYTTNVRYENAALNLSVKPQITREGRVVLEISVENSVPDFSQTVREIPTIVTSESHTRVLVADGATTIIGGIFVEKNLKGEHRVPGFSGIPILGRLFKRSDEASETREVIFFITPRIQGDT
jgi:type IV pilus assembly protein PilQ